MAKAEIIDHQHTLPTPNAKRAKDPNLEYVIVEGQTPMLDRIGQMTSLYDYYAEPSIIDPSKPMWTDVTETTHIPGVSLSCRILACDKREKELSTKQFINNNAHNIPPSSKELINMTRGDNKVSETADLDGPLPKITGFNLLTQNQFGDLDETEPGDEF